uniref:Uncharacterized protein n=1 Tax=Ditylenchus dipsaci TaxID=166011 RepID=A0A915EDW6_9BILA
MLFIYSIFISFVFVVEFTHGSHHLDRNHHHVFIWKLLVDNAIENVGEMDLNTTTTEQQAKLAITTEYNTGPINKLFKGSATADMTLITNLSNIRNGDHIIIVQYIENFRFVSVYHLRGNANYFMGYMYLNCTTTAKQAKEAIKVDLTSNI